VGPVLPTDSGNLGMGRDVGEKDCIQRHYPKMGCSHIDSKEKGYLKEG